MKTKIAKANALWEVQSALMASILYKDFKDEVYPIPSILILNKYLESIELQYSQ